MKSWIYLLVVTFSLKAYSQVYHFPETAITFFKGTNFGTVHGYLEIVNDTGDSVLMRWISRWEENCPTEWQFNFDDQNSYYFPVMHLDSADFWLKPPDLFLQKMIIGLNHHGVADTHAIHFTIFPVNDRADSTNILYNFSIKNVPPDTNNTDTTDSSNSISSIQSLPSLKWHWDDQLELWLNDQFHVLNVYSLTGDLLFTQTNLEPGQHLFIELPVPFALVELRKRKGVYYLKVARNG